MASLTSATMAKPVSAKVQTVAKNSVARSLKPASFMGSAVAFKASFKPVSARKSMMVKAEATTEMPPPEEEFPEEEMMMMQEEEPEMDVDYSQFKNLGAPAFISTGNPEIDDMILNSYPNPDFIARTLTEFPEAGIANVEQAMALVKDGGYTIVDVRSTLEFEESKVPQSVNIPVINVEKKYDSETRTKVVQKSENKEFVAQFQKKFANKDQKFIIMCSGRNMEIDGASIMRSMECLGDLDEAGYTNLVGLKGGYNRWTSTFDNKMNRRRGDGFVENYNHSATSCGIHGTGAGFAKMDAIEKWIPTQY